ncbi:DUF3642 domain-containing protein [Streptococcus suis]|uniref:DUF3642 domain-containing protein n=1 Tax=Streptococcus suis TaxID=1307 RepID=UPI001C98C71F|nr:DUF3642 domain-containing protein [Streptococcus suis]MBY5009692.1 hypothetical protein [Streptococcus suis]MDG4517867.1 DUF3642 domain-containing protein [Streptococcus suis]
MEQHNQPELIEATENSKKTILESVKNRLTSMSKKTMILLSVGILTLATAGVVLAEVYDSKIEVLGNQIEQQVGIVDDDDNQQVIAQANASSASSENTTSASQLATSYGVKLVDTSELDGTYTATSGNDTYTLTVKGNQATLTEVDKDGNQDIEQVIFDLDKKLAYIDGEVDSYTLNGPTLTLTEIDANDTTLEKLILTKQ